MVHPSPSTTHPVPAFAIWLTGLPASGKSSITAALRPKLEALGSLIEVLESDALRRVLTPEASYSREERDLFYRAMAYFGSRLVAHGISVIFDATANRRRYRDLARELIPNFMEVAVECPLNVCMARDKKGTYERGQSGASGTVPGLNELYEAPPPGTLSIDTTHVKPEKAAGLIVRALRQGRHLPPGV